MIQENKRGVIGKQYRLNNWVTKMVNIFNWRALYNRIPTCDSLTRRNIQVTSYLCRFFGEHVEKVEHIFVSCGLAMEVWSKVASWCNIRRIFAFSFGDLLEIPYALSEDVDSLCTTWSVWKHRNSIVFEGCMPSLINVVCDIRVTAGLWLKVRSRYRAMMAMALNNFPFVPS